MRSPDSDLFFILLHYVLDLQPLEILLDTGMGYHRRLINISELASGFGQEFCTVLLAFYVFTGEDTNSAFKGKGKITPLKKIQRARRKN